MERGRFREGRDVADGQLRTVIRYLRRVGSAQVVGKLTDAQLLERFVNRRDEAAFEVLVWRHAPLVFGVCRRVLRHEQDAEDAFQATFLALVRKAASIGKRQSIGSWLYKVAYRVALEARERAAKRVGHVPLPAELPGGETGRDLLWRDLRPVLDEEVSALPGKYRIPFVLCYLEGKTNEEAAHEIGCPVGTIVSRLAWARERLRLRLTRRGVTLASGALAASAVPEASAAVCSALIDSTIKTAAASAAGPAAAGTIPASVAALTEGVLRNMFLNKLKTAVAVLLAVATVGTAGALWRPARAAPPDDSPAKGEKPAPEITTIGGFESGAVKKVDPKDKSITILSTSFPSVNNLGWLSPYILQPRPLIYGENSLVYPPALQYTGNSFVYPQLYNNVLGTAYLTDTSYVTGTRHYLNATFRSTEVRRKLAPDAKVIIDGKEAKLTDLAPDVYIDLTLDDKGLVTRIEATGNTVDCLLEAVDPARHALTVATKEDAEGADKKLQLYDVTKDAAVRVNGTERKFTDLKAGMRVSLQLSALKPVVVGVRAAGPTVECLLKAVDTARRTLTVNLPHQHLTIKDLPLAKDAKVLLNGKEAGLADLKAGTRVTLQMGAETDTNLVVGVRAGKAKEN
jgi:RNA polymerase sigma factor (sigma-70 family)